MAANTMVVWDKNPPPPIGHRVKKDHGNITAEFPKATHANKGLIERSRYFEGGKKVTLITRPRINLCQQPRYIPDQCKMLLKLISNKSRR